MESTSQHGELLAGRYRLRELLGRGGMGSVWAADDEMLERAVAIKEVAFPSGLDPEQRRTLHERMLREARAAARLSSSATVTVYDVVEADDRPWIVMERVDAPSLSEILQQRGALPPAEVAGIGRSVLGALDEAHAAGVLHRDVKPANIMVREDGRAVLTDFGIALLEGDASLTTTGMVVGSPAYMAPERARGETATAASDLWSLGVTMYAAVEGRPPFDRGGQLPTLNAVANEEPPHATQAGALAPVLAALLAKTPAERPNHARLRETLDRLQPVPVTTTPVSAPPGSGARSPGEQTQVLAVSQAAVAGEPSTQPPSAPEKGSPRPRRRPAVLALSALVFLAALVGVGYLAWGGDRSGGTAAQDRARDQNASRESSGAVENRAGAAQAEGGSSQEGEGSGDRVSGDAGNAGRPVPAGFRLHRDPTGFAVAVPKGWQVKREGSLVNFVDPDGGGFLRIGQTTDPKPDPVADWRSQEESVSQDLPGYKRIRIEPVDYRGWEAADWEFTWQSDGGQIHVLNRNVITGPDHAYALYWSMPEGSWEQSLSAFRAVARSFRPEG